MARETDTRRTAALETARGAAPQVPGAHPLVIKGACGAGGGAPAGRGAPSVCPRGASRSREGGGDRHQARTVTRGSVRASWSPPGPKKAPILEDLGGRGHSSSASSSTATRSTPSASRKTLAVPLVSATWRQGTATMRPVLAGVASPLSSKRRPSGTWPPHAPDSARHRCRSTPRSAPPGRAHAPCAGARHTSRTAAPGSAPRTALVSPALALVPAQVLAAPPALARDQKQPPRRGASRCSGRACAVPAPWRACTGRPQCGYSRCKGRPSHLCFKTVLASFPAHGSSVTEPLSWVHSICAVIWSWQCPWMSMRLFLLLFLWSPSI